MAGAKEGVARSIGDTAGFTLAQAVQELLKHGVERAKTAMDDASKDLITTKGPMDNAGGSIIKLRYRKRNQENYQVLMRLLSHLTKPQKEDFNVVSICHLNLAKGTGKEKVTSSKSEEFESQHSQLLMGIDFTQGQTFSSLFELYDLIIHDFLELEKNNQANSRTVVELLQKNSLYGDETMSKRLAGLLVRAEDWKEIPGRLVKEVAKIATEVAEGAAPTLNKIGGAIDNFSGGTDALAKMRARVKGGKS